MNCRKVSHLLSAYIDAELAGVEYRLIREHLTHCKECSSEYEGLLQTKRILARLRVQTPKDDLPNRILDYIEVETQRANADRALSWSQRLHQWLHQASPVPQGMAIGALAAGVALFLVAHAPEQPTDKIQWTQLSAKDISPLGLTPPGPISGLTSSASSSEIMPVVYAPRAHAWPAPSPSYQMVSSARAHSILASPFARFGILVSSNHFNP